ncbi:MAG TPA: hypothetical protein VKA55_03845 [Gammaproteobacteria bacterium]|nr:hypothetical protein [Gammaproteobacteria bacterium]
MSKLAVVLLSDMEDPVKVEMALRFTVVAHRERRLEDLRFYFFGPGVRVPAQLAEYPELREQLETLLEAGITTTACIFNARQLEEEDSLREAEITMQGIGPELTDLVARGYEVMTF